MALLKGLATPEGSEHFARRAVETRHLPPEHFRGAPGHLRLSSLGLGTYLGQPDAVTDHAVEQAVVICVTSGRVNVLDTAINYRMQRAERSVGRAVHRAVEQGTVAREELFVATKVGYRPPTPRGVSRRRSGSARSWSTPASSTPRASWTAPTR